MENNHPLSELMRTTLDSVRAMADANTIVGAPIQADGVTLIPVSKLSFGVAGGGTEFTTKKQPAGDNAFGGGSGASAKLEPVAFLVVPGEGGVKLLPVAPPPATTADGSSKRCPRWWTKVTNFIKDQQDRKEKTADLAD